MKIILSCKCGDTPTFARDAYSLLFPDAPTPNTYIGGAAIERAASRFSSTSEAYQYIMGVANSREKYAVYLDVNDNGGIVEAYNLLTGNRIQ